MSPRQSRALLVEDDPAVQVALLDALGDAGFEVVGAPDAVETLRVLAQRRSTWSWPTIIRADPVVIEVPASVERRAHRPSVQYLSS